VRAQLDEAMFRPLRSSRRPAQTLLDLIEVQAKAHDSAMANLGCPLNNLAQEMSCVDSDFHAALHSIIREWQDAVKEALLRAHFTAA
jgi:tRNA1(Val) A37 N6-methylase TrmN6